MPGIHFKLYRRWQAVLLCIGSFSTPLACCLFFPELAFFIGSIFIGLPFGVMLIASIPLYVYLARINKEPVRNQITCLCFLTGLLLGCALVILPRMEYFEYLLASVRR